MWVETGKCILFINEIINLYNYVLACFSQAPNYTMTTVKIWVNISVWEEMIREFKNSSMITLLSIEKQENLKQTDIAISTCTEKKKNLKISQW